MNSPCPHIRVTTFLTYRKSQFRVVDWKHLETGQIDLIRNVAVLRNVKKKILSQQRCLYFISFIFTTPHCRLLFRHHQSIKFSQLLVQGYWVNAKYNYASLYLGNILVSGFPKLCTAVLSLGFAVRSIQLMFTILQQEMTN